MQVFNSCVFLQFHDKHRNSNPRIFLSAVILHEIIFVLFFFTLTFEEKKSSFCRSNTKI